jgi:pimeloyl-ACP methyl ester carboxylesterase
MTILFERTTRTLLALAFLAAPGAADQERGVTEVGTQQAQRTEDVRFPNGDVELAGTLFLPATGGPHPALVVTHGSGREGRHLAGVRGFATTLAEEGLAVLLYDKRGIGDSGGEYVETPDLMLPAQDVLAAVEHLHARADVDPRRIGVFGHSQGGWVGPLAASLSDDIAFLISTCGPGVSVREQVLYRTGQELAAAGHAPERVDELVAFARELYTYLGSGEGYEELAPRYEELATSAWFAPFRAELGAELPAPDALDAPFFDFYRRIRYDPRPALERVFVQTLALFGADDRQVPTEASVQVWRQAFARSGNPWLTLHVLPGEGHALWDASGEQPVMRAAFREPLLAWLRSEVLAPGG